MLDGTSSRLAFKSSSIYYGFHSRKFQQKAFNVIYGITRVTPSEYQSAELSKINHGQIEAAIDHFNISPKSAVQLHPG